jgi:DNA-binding NarL/FixJ family response regulator
MSPACGLPCSSHGLRCLIVDDSPRFLEAARGLLEREGIVVVGVAPNGADAVRLAVELRPDVCLVDIGCRTCVPRR